MSDDREDPEKKVALWLVGTTVVLAVAVVAVYGVVQTWRHAHPSLPSAAISGLDPLLSAQISHASLPPKAPPTPSTLSNSTASVAAPVLRDSAPMSRTGTTPKHKRASAGPSPPAEAVIYFGLGESKLPPGTDAALTRIANRAKALPRHRIVIFGYHDATGSPARNTRIALERARSVRAALLVRGVASQRMALAFPSGPVATGPASEARRVEVRLIRSR